jgi:DNA-binding XRE family transcriptional regulator
MEKHLVGYMPWTASLRTPNHPAPMRADQVSAAFGRVLREQRTAAGVSQEALALSADVDRTFVSQIERGIRQPTLTTLCKLARALDVQPSTLVSRMEKLLR